MTLPHNLANVLNGEIGSQARTLPASLVSRKLHDALGIVTVPDANREGYRVQQSTPYEVRVTAQFDSDNMAVRKIDHVADYLGSAGGFAVRCTSATTIYVTR